MRSDDIKITPVPYKKNGELVAGDIVELVKADKTLSCAYVGQQGKVICYDSKYFMVALKCGHLCFFDKSVLKKIGHEELVLFKKR